MSDRHPRHALWLECLRAAADTCSAEELKAIDRVIRPGTNVSPYYEADWETAEYRW